MSVQRGVLVSMEVSAELSEPTVIVYWVPIDRGGE